MIGKQTLVFGNISCRYNKGMIIDRFIVEGIYTGKLNSKNQEVI